MWVTILPISVVQVIFETSRLATVVNGVLRKTTKDVELKGKCNKTTLSGFSVKRVCSHAMIFYFPQDSLFQKDGEYMCTQEKLIMIHPFIRIL